jgi:putative aldouronate transport system substrate-binding protein
MKRLDINVTWIHPPQGQFNESFNLMVASGDLPDMIYRGWSGYPGGPEKAISDGVIIKMNDLIAKSAPNLTQRYKEHPEWLKQAKTDSGTLYMFPFIRGDDDLLVFFGPQGRMDWLDKLGLDRPVTLDDWEKMLYAMKNAGLAEYPLTFTKFSDGRGINGPGNAFIQPFGTTWDFHQDDQGKVHFGPYDNQFKDFLVFFKDWFDKGLVDPEFFSLPRQSFDAKILNGEVGAWTSYTGSGIGAYLDAYKGPGPYDIVPFAYPVKNAGETPFFGQRDNYIPGNDGMAITTKAKDLELCAEWGDYPYSDEGHILFSFGIEGESFNWVYDYPGFEGQKFAKYTELMMHNPQGRTLSQMGGLYTRDFYSGPEIQDRQYIYQYANRPAQREALTLWGETDAEKHMLPPITATPSEAEELAQIMSEVQTYREEMVVKFITGQEPIDNFGQFQARLKQMGIERAIAIKQAGLERFNAR